MAHNTRIRTAGNWTTNSTVLQAEFEALDQAQFEAINGDDGGTWAPSAAIIIGGSGLQVTGDFASSGAFEHSGAGTASFQGALVEILSADFQIGCPATFGDAAVFDGTVTCNTTFTANANVNLGNGAGDLVTVAGTLDVNTALNVDGTSAFQAAVIFNTGSDPTFVAPTVFTGAMDINGDVDISNPVTLSGDGHIRERIVNGSDANTTYNVSTVDRVVMTGSVLSANRVWTAGNTGAGEGSVLRFSRYTDSGAFNVEIRRQSDSALLVTLGQSSVRSCTLVYHSGDWRVVEIGA